ncbi:MAG: hypothetical protein IKQ62_00295 [Bacteroidaceae bacterium]|nr:hypothetical protein [Bacteroidaceae bacterium]
MKSPNNYFSEKTLSHIKLQQGLPERYQRRALDVTLACKLTQTYGKYHLAMLHRELFMSEEKTSYQQAERMAAMMNQMTIIHSSPSDFLQTKEESVNECIDTYKEFRQLVDEYADEYFVPNVVEEFCKKVYADDEHFIFFKPFCNLYYSVYADALLWYQQGKIDYETFCREFQELSWMDGKRTPLNGRRLKMYIASMREVVDFYKTLKNHRENIKKC